jgi:hypothetical protein
MEQAKALKPKQLNAIKMLATGIPAYVVAERLEVTTMTLWRWQRLPEFENTLNSISHSGLNELARKINIAALTAVEVVQECLCDMREPSATRLKAAAIALRAMPGVNSALTNAHLSADFDTRSRSTGPAFTYNGQGRPCWSGARSMGSAETPEAVEV